MKKWTMPLFVCLELLANATRASEPRESKVLTKKVAALESPVENSSSFNPIKVIRQ